MALTLPRHLIIAAIVATVMIIGGFSLFTSLLEVNPDIATNPQLKSFNATLNKADELQSSIEGIQSSIENADTDFGVFGVLNSLISSAWQGLRLLFTSLGFITDIFTSMGSLLGIPAWIPAISVLIIVVILAFSIWSVIFQKDV